VIEMRINHVGASPWPTIPLADPSRLPGRAWAGGQAGRPESGSGTGGQACGVLLEGGHARARPLHNIMKINDNKREVSDEL